jgi:cobalt-zinc-cadmium efflux system outer membrane protein
MVRHSILVLILALPRLSVAGGSDSVLTVEYFVGRALASNPGLESERQRSVAAVARIPQAGAWPAPEGGVMFDGIPTSTLNPLRYGMEVDYYLQQMFPVGGARGLMRDGAEHFSAAARSSARVREREVIARVKTAFAMLYAAREQQVVTLTNIHLLDQLIASTRVRFGVGRASETDVLKLGIERARLENDQSGLNQQAASAEAMLASLCSLPDGTRIGPIAAPAATPLLLSLDALQSTADSLQPEIASMQAMAAMAEAERQAARREFIPEVMLRGTYRRMKTEMDVWTAMVGISLPFAPWSIGQVSGRIDERDAQARSAQFELAQAKNMTRENVRTAYASVSSLWQQLVRFDRSILPDAEHTLELTLNEFQSNTADFLALLDTYRMVQMARMERIMVAARYFTAKAELERAVGVGLE